MSTNQTTFTRQLRMGSESGDNVQHFWLRLDHGWGEISLPSRITERDIEKLRKVLELISFDIEDETPQSG